LRLLTVDRQKPIESIYLEISQNPM